MKQSQRIAKNVLVGGLAVGIGGFVQLLAVVIIARSVSVSDFGVYSFILALTMFCWLLADAGLSNILVREIATQPEKMAEIFGAALTLIWVLSLGGELLIVAVLPFLHFSLPIKFMTALLGVATLTQFHCSGYGALLLAHEDNEVRALGLVLNKCLFLALIYIGFQTGWGLLGVVMAHLIPTLLQWWFFRYIVTRRYGHPKLRWNPPFWKLLLTHSLPVGGAGMLRALTQQVDVLILTWLTTVQTVGLFSGPYRISMALCFVAQAMSLPLYPMYSRLAKDPERKLELEETYQRSVKFLLLLAVPIAVLFLMCSHRVIASILGVKFVAAIPAMQWLAIAFVPYFLSSPLPFLITALHEQRYLLISTATTVGLRIAFNFALVPVFGFLGPCIAFLVTESLTAGLWINKLSRLGYSLHLAAILWRFLVASLLMAIPLYFAWQRPVLIFASCLALSVLVYAVSIFKLGVLSKKDQFLAREGMGFLKPFLAARANRASDVIS